MGKGGKYCAGTWFHFNLRIHFCILALISLSASPCFNRENMLVSVTSAAFDNNMSHYLYLKGFNTVRTNTIWNVNTEEVLQRHLLVAARALECQDKLLSPGQQGNLKEWRNIFVLDEVQKDSQKESNCLNNFFQKPPPAQNLFICPSLFGENKFIIFFTIASVINGCWGKPTM